MGVEQAGDARLERIKFAGTRLAASLGKGRSRQSDRDRAPMKPEGASGLGNGAPGIRGARQWPQP
jgi:hypothetical protein